MAQTIKLKRSSTGGAVPSTSSLSLGEVAINTYDGKMYIKKNDGSDAIVEIGGANDQAIWNSYDYTATSSQTSFSGSDNNSQTLSYVPDFLQVFLNGILLDPAVDYAATTGTSVVLTVGATTSDLIQIETFTQVIGTGDILVDTFPVSSTQTAFTLSQDPINKNNISVYVEGVYQESSTYSLSTNTLTLSQSPANGNTVEVVIGTRNVTLDSIVDLTISGTLHAGALDLGDANIINVNEISLDTIKGDADANTNITFAGSDVTTFTQGGAERLRLNTTGAQVTGNIVVSGNVDGRDVAADGVTADAALPRAGGAMSGAITTNSTFDGRDVSVDGTKLDTIEVSATADQTDAEIRTAIEAASDSNVFTDADHSKLDAIEASADVTDATNVTAAGALMDSEVTNLAQVKAFASSDYATAAQGTTAGAALPKAGGTMTGNLNMGDNVKAQLGASNDLEIYHDGSHSYIKNSEGELKIYGDQNQVAIRIDDGYGNSVQLLHAGSTKLYTTGSGVTMQYGATFGKDAVVSNYLNAASESQYATIQYFQAKNTFQSGVTNGSNFGGLEFYQGYAGATTGATGYVRGIANGTSGNMNIEIQTGTAGSLTTKILVKDAGIDVTGNIAVSGTVDGVDIAARDAILTSTTTTAGAALPKAGGTMTGTLAMGANAITSTGTLSTGAITGTTATASGGTNTTALASTAFVQQEITTLIGGAPSTLNDLNELAAAINDDANYNSTLTTALATKLPLAGGTMTGNLIQSVSVAGNYAADFKNTNATNGYGLRATTMHTGASGYAFAAYAASTALMVVRGDGNVGIGTTSPSEKLHVQGDGADILLTDAAGGQTAKLGATGSNNGLLELNNSAHVGKVILNSSGDSFFNGGKVGIGTASPSTALHVNQNGDNNGITLSNDLRGTAKVSMQLSGTNNEDYSFRHYDGTDTDVLSLHGRTQHIFNINNAEAMRISGGKVGIGTASASSMNAGANQLVVGSGSTGQGMTIYSSATTAGSIHFADGTSGNAAYRGQLVYNHNGDYMAMLTAASEAMRITSDGNLLVGQTSGSSSATGHIFNPIGVAFHIRDGGVPLVAVRQTSDGELIQLKKDTTVVGSIGTRAGVLKIGSGDTGLAFNPTNDSIFPEDMGGTYRDAAIDLGVSAARFKDLHLSGNANVGGTISSGAITSTGILTLDTSPASNGTGDLRIIPSLSNSSGVGYAGQVLGVNIATAVHSTHNAPVVYTTWGGVTGAAAIALQADDNSYGQFQVWTAPQDSSANDLLVPRFWIAGSGAATFSSSVTSTGVYLNNASNGYLWNTANGGIQFGTNNTERMRIDASGNVGIGNTSPSHPLTIGTGTIAAPHSGTPNMVLIGGLTAGLTISNTSNSGTGSIFFGDAANSTVGQIRYNHNTGDMAFTAEDDFTFAGGNVGIGTSTPDDKLDVENGNIRLTSNSDGNTGLFRMFDASGTEAGQVYPAAGDIKIWSPNDVLIIPTGNVGIGTTAPGAKLHMKDGNNSILLDGRTDGGNVAGTGAANVSAIDGIYASNTIPGARIAFAHQGSAGQRGGLTFASKNTDDSSNQPTVQGVLTAFGNWGFGTTNPQYKVEVAGTLGVTGAAAITGDLIVQNSNDRPKISLKDSTGSARGEIYIGNTAAGDADEDATYINTYGESVHVKGAFGVNSGGTEITRPSNTIAVFSHTDGYANVGVALVSASGNSCSIYMGDTADPKIGEFKYANATDTFSLSKTLSVSGAVNKTGGTFKIDHPLPEKADTHHLVHSFTESPQADLLYSGTSDLVDGAAEINLDEYHGMTEGTFVALNRNIRVFTTNETDWEPIKGSVTGNILSISCQDASCSDTVSWMVIGERHDDTIKALEFTDEQGRVIVEPLKPEEPAQVQRTVSVPVMLDGEQVEALETIDVPESIKVIDGVAVLTAATTKEVLKPQFEYIGVVDVDGNPVYE